MTRLNTKIECGGETANLSAKMTIRAVGVYVKEQRVGLHVKSWLGAEVTSMYICVCGWEYQKSHH